MNRLILLVESRIRGNVYVRFGGEYLKTHRRNMEGRRMLSLTKKMMCMLWVVARLWKNGEAQILDDETQYDAGAYSVFVVE